MRGRSLALALGLAAALGTAACESEGAGTVTLRFEAREPGCGVTAYTDRNGDDLSGELPGLPIVYGDSPVTWESDDCPTALWVLTGTGVNGFEGNGFLKSFAFKCRDEAFVVATDLSGRCSVTVEE